MVVTNQLTAFQSRRDHKVSVRRSAIFNGMTIIFLLQSLLEESCILFDFTNIFHLRFMHKVDPCDKDMSEHIATI